MSYKTTSAVLFLIFNRPDKTQMVFTEIRKAAPKRLYVAADGPRPNNISDDKLCKVSRDIIKMIDWECDIKTRFNEVNEGCKLSVSNSINWFFNNEKEGIILEDDCLPVNSFFRFCDEMLNKYRNNQKIAHIGGANFQKGLKRGNGSYYFSKLTHVWGWAGWRRSWDGYDVNIKNFETFFEIIKSEYLNFSTTAVLHLENQYKKINTGQLNTWDYQYAFLNLKRNTYAVVPNTNLVSNIGFDKNATHTFLLNDNLMSASKEITFPLIHPEDIIANLDADELTLRNETPSYLKVYIDDFVIKVKSILNKLVSSF